MIQVGKRVRCLASLVGKLWLGDDEHTVSVWSHVRTRSGPFMTHPRPQGTHNWLGGFVDRTRRRCA